MDRVSSLVSFSQTGRSEPCDNVVCLQQLFATKRSVKTSPVCNSIEQMGCDLYVMMNWEVESGITYVFQQRFSQFCVHQ
jgi:hypothetical protein